LPLPQERTNRHRPVLGNTQRYRCSALLSHSCLSFLLIARVFFSLSHPDFLPLEFFWRIPLSLTNSHTQDSVRTMHRGRAYYNSMGICTNHTTFSSSSRTRCSLFDIRIREQDDEAVPRVDLDSASLSIFTGSIASHTRSSRADTMIQRNDWETACVSISYPLRFRQRLQGDLACSQSLVNIRSAEKNQTENPRVLGLIFKTGRFRAFASRDVPGSSL